MSRLQELADRFTPLIGTGGTPVVRMVSASDIERYARSVGSTNPIYWDREAALRGPHCGVVAPPTFLSTLRPPAPGDGDLGLPVVNGGNKFAYERPVRPGDTIVGHGVLQSVELKSSRSGSALLFLTKRSSFINQWNESVATLENIRVVREPAS